ncbi:substrate-binding domain-containing protein [Pelomonas sp. KK5]|uniref:substrate-binding domain-containing protein n=1 Tax=Pelomonas sp. KK5 TaxID=1855730 RepID=UPI00097BDE75|nr:substrate-binding domain-containing protein [Pelomonas sp. KK5]
MQTLTGITSMATRALAADLAARFAEAHGRPVDLQSGGGVDVARRIRAGERFDLVLLAEDALQKLAAEGFVQAVHSFADSEVVVAVPEGRAAPDISNETALRDAVLTAKTIGYSTGPSGTSLLQRFEAWGLTETLKPRLMQAPTGIPVATLLARGEVDLGFQQRSELQGAPGITLLGALPEAVAIRTRFSAALGADASEGAQALLEFFCAASAADLKLGHGMAPPTP